MNVAVLGGTGHIASALVPGLAAEGARVTAVSRGRREPVPGTLPDGARRVEAEYRRGDPAFFEAVADLDADVIVDLLGIDLPGVYDAVRGRTAHVVACGSFWMYGPPRVVPTPEETQGPCEFEAYARRWAEIRRVRERARADGVAFTAVMPSNICGPGKVPLEARGGRDPAVHRAHARGEPVALPEGCGTLVAPCDVVDVAAVFRLAVRERDAAAGEVFNAGPARALTAPAFVAAYGEIHGVEIPVTRVPGERFYSELLPDAGANYHFRAHMAPDISRAREALGYRPRHEPEEAMARAVRWMREEGILRA